MSDEKTPGRRTEKPDGAKDRPGGDDVGARLEALLDERILIMDGAMGTMIQRHGLDEAAFRGERFAGHGQDLKGNNDLLVLTRPDVIGGIHHAYFEAGSDIVETNTFSSTAIAQSDYGLEGLAYELNVESARLARAAADDWTRRTPDRPRFVAGAIGPTNRTLSISPDVNDPGLRASTFDAMRDAYAEQARGLLDGGCDLLLVETIFDTLNAKAALVAIGDVFDARGAAVPLMISVTVTDRSGRTLSGQTIDAFYVSIRHARPLSVGINCALGARDMRPYLAELAAIAECRVSCYPNAGLPNAFGEYDETPDETAGLLGEFAESGFVNILGGCCGTTPEHIAAIARAVDGTPPRAVPAVTLTAAGARAQVRVGTATLGTTGAPGASRFSGLETLAVRDDGTFLMVGERTNVTGSARFARLVKSGDLAAAADVALDQVRGGANLIDVNMDEALLDSEATMTRFLNLVATEPEIARVPVMIDSSKWSVIEAGLKCVQGKPVVNSIQPQGGRGRLPREGPDPAALRRGGGGDGVRRGRAGRHDRSQGRDLPARVQAAHRAGGVRPRGHRLRPQHPRGGDRARGARRLRRQLHRGDADDQAHLPRRPRQRRRQQPLVLVPRQQPGARGDALGVPLPRHRGGHGHGHRQRRPARRLRGHRARAADPRRGHHLSTAAPTPPSAWCASRRPSRAAGRPAPRTSRGGRER